MQMKSVAEAGPGRGDTARAPVVMRSWEEAGRPVGFGTRGSNGGLLGPGNRVPLVSLTRFLVP